MLAEGRFVEHPTAIQNAIAKHGFENFRHELIVDGLTEPEAYEHEVALVHAMGSYVKFHGYNQTMGGEGGTPLSPTEASARISDGVKRWHAARKKEGILMAEPIDVRFESIKMLINQMRSSLSFKDKGAAQRVKEVLATYADQEKLLIEKFLCELLNAIRR